MSLEMIAQVLKMSNASLSRAEHRMLMVLAYHANRETGFAYPGRRLLARELLITERHVKRLIQGLVKAGYLEVARGQGRGHLSVYRLRVPPGEVIHRKGDISGSSRRRKGDILTQEKGTFSHTPYKEVEPRERKEARVRACGWSGCVASACPHWQFCAYHACCPTCEGAARGGDHQALPRLRALRCLAPPLQARLGDGGRAAGGALRTMGRWGKRWMHLPGEAPQGAKRVGGRYAHATGGKRADLGGLYVRSNMEANYLRFLSFLGIPWHYEPRRFIFHAVVSGKNRVYVPDVYLPKAKEFHEIKGWMDKNSAIKLRRMAKFYPTIKVVVIGPEFFRDVCARRLCRVIPGYECPHTRGRT